MALLKSLQNVRKPTPALLAVVMAGGGTVQVGQHGHRPVHGGVRLHGGPPEDQVRARLVLLEHLGESLSS